MIPALALQTWAEHSEIADQVRGHVPPQRREWPLSVAPVAQHEDRCLDIVQLVTAVNVSVAFSEAKPRRGELLLMISSPDPLA
jgi:hypothetical protein